MAQKGMEAYKKNITQYSSEIKTISNASQAIRQTPGQFIGYIGNKGFINMIREVLQNSMDEFEKRDSPCDEIWTEYHEDTKMFVCTDNGRGIPFNNMERIFGCEHTSSNYSKKAGEFSAGLHGQGAKATQALSHKFIIESFMCKEVSPDGKPHARRAEFVEGVFWDKGEIEIPNKNNFQGTRISFTPSSIIMEKEGKITVTCKDIMNLISLLLPLMDDKIIITPKGEIRKKAIINFSGFSKSGDPIPPRRTVNEDGIIAFLFHMTQKPIISPIKLSAGNDRMKADIAFTWANDQLGSDAEVMSFANMCPTVSPQSSHAIGFVDGLATYFRNYMNKIYLGKNSKIAVTNADVKSGLKAVVAVMHIEPMFSGQAKEIFSNADVIPFIKNLIQVGLDDWMKKNPEDVQRICKFIKDAATLRLSVDKEKIGIMKKSAVSVFTGLPSKYAKPTGRKHLELILVEGDSAKSPCQTARDPKRQGIFPLRGKFKNAFSYSKKDFFNNEEAKAIYTILGCGEGKKCDPKKCPFDKIILMADADPDGLHIRTLLLKMFLVYYKPLVEEGRIYAAVPPLYSITNKKNGKLSPTQADYLKYKKYFTDKKEYVDYVYSIFMKSNEVLNAKKQKLSGQTLKEFLLYNYSYPTDMGILAATYAADPQLLEFTYRLITQGASLKAIQNKMAKAYPYVFVDSQNKILTLNGLIGDTVQTLVFNDGMLQDCQRYISQYVTSPYYSDFYYLNGKKVTLYELMSEFHKFVPSSVQRYKGLGEMNDVELKISTLHPDFNRTLLRYTAKDMESEIAEIRRIDSNLNSLLKDVDIAGYEI